MVEIKNILVPVDFSEVSEFVAEWAKDFAKKLNAKVHVVFVLEDFAAYEGLYGSIKTLTDLENVLLESAQKSMEEFIKKHFADYPEAQSIIVKGDVVEKIIETGQKLQADLIIMGTHGRKGLDKILFGSVANGVVKNSPIPVLTINPYRLKKG
ncbi:universal stress protein [Thermodesulfobacterium sp. TA1]|uniref:universal stress protein n=1 Tax=Thermodesulfobacterium sp. TA1 TaxID=2234087 RepID=UPI001231C406|nr:universal stress protein [Thermodesulfobacterium sp. TA1]QER41254.1 universal stress protein [Thermodesulfobacterium sp. TA1]